MHLFHQTSSKAACQLSVCCLLTGQKDPALSEMRTECIQATTPSVSTAGGTEDISYRRYGDVSFTTMSLTMARNQVPEKRSDLTLTLNQTATQLGLRPYEKDCNHK